ncbi:MAG: hypothetical protein LJE69_09540 [Thiohalocapsa sp.]|uniref:hypothetical protein n=1 Tax=Thiohalocapsa sp. TaxID=2497641 RepID=UPI0025E360E0|nr:hypothetical protein [Thiohalocapsa sp.]MCG6941479.1 hypothetical protein [Thiohalocapsa sp.]
MNIEQVVSVIIEHLRMTVMHELGGRAKAMVVTGSRLAAVRYKLAFDHYLDNFSSFLERMLDELFIERMEGNEEIFSRVMSDPAFRTETQQHLALEIFGRVRTLDE